MPDYWGMFWKAWNASNWDTFIPDLVVALFTGLVVGAALAIVTSAAARRARKTDTRLRWEALRPRVGAQLLNPMRREHMYEDLPAWANQLAPLREIVQDVPLASWAKILHKRELTSLHELVKASYELSGAAIKFEAFLIGTSYDLIWPKNDDGEPEPGGIPSDEDLALVMDAMRPVALKGDEWAEGPWSNEFFESAHNIIALNEVIEMIDRVERYYGECANAMVDADSTRFYYH